MPIIKVTKEEIAKTKKLRPDWYNFVIVKAFVKRAKDGESDNYVVDFKGLSGEAEDVIVRQTFSEKFIAAIFPLFAALGVQIVPGTDLDFSALEGKTVQALSKLKEYQGREFNNLEEFRPAA